MSRSYAKRLSHFAILACCLLAAHALSMTDPTTTSTVPNTKNFVSDINGIKELTHLGTADLNRRDLSAPLWKDARRKIIIRLMLTNNLWEFLVDFAAAKQGAGAFAEEFRITLKEYDNKGGKSGGARDPNYNQKDVRLRAINIIEAFLPDCEWKQDLIRLSHKQPVLAWFHDLDVFSLQTTRGAMLHAQSSCFSLC